MPDETTILSLPLIQPAQAQKHVTHNEALRLLDVAVQLAVKNRTLNAPPASPALGDRHIVDGPASGDWAGHGGDIAVFTETGWDFVQPLAGWRAHVLAEGQTAVFTGTAWEIPGAGGMNPAMLGVNTTASTTNRLAVASEASLFTHDGAGHQMKINKASAADTASLLFQSGFSGRAEMGLAGTNDFAVKVSANGSSFTTALVCDAAGGIVGLPQGVQVGYGSATLPGIGFDGDADTGLFRAGANQIGFATAGLARGVLGAAAFTLDVPMQGSAVQDAVADTLPPLGALIPVGMGNSLSHKGVLAAGADLNAVHEPGVYRIATGADAAAISNTPASTTGALLEVMNQGTPGARGAAAFVVQRYTMRRNAGGVPRVWLRQNNSSTADSWGPWTEGFSQGTLLGTVSQAAGVPTGAVIERGTGSNGDYVRFADGTQICTRTNLAAANASTALGALFRSADVSWTYPMAFAVAPVVSGDVDGSDAWLTTATPGAASSVLRVLAAVSKTASLNIRAMAVGRWF